MTRLVQNCFKIALQTDGIHENKRKPHLFERVLIAAWRFSVAIGQIEQFSLVHFPKASGHLFIKVVENLLSPIDHAIHLLKGAQWRAIQRIDSEVPWPQRTDAKLLATARLQLADYGYDLALNRSVELVAILRRVVETASRTECILDITLEAGVRRD